MFKKIIISLIGISSFVFANNFHDLDYLFYKYKIRYTIQQLEKLKNLYPRNSTKYKILQQTQNYFMQNMPIDAYGTYVRIKLHNIIDNKLSEKKIQKEHILSADTDLNALYYEREQELKNTKQMNKTSKEQQLKKMMLSPNSLSPDQLKFLLQTMNQ